MQTCTQSPSAQSKKLESHKPQNHTHMQPIFRASGKNLNQRQCINAAVV